jgi:hypothetical protein
MTLEENEDIDLNPGLWASQAGSEKHPPAKTKVPPALTRCAEIAPVIPIIILLLPVYVLIQMYAGTVGTYRILRVKIRRHVPNVCSVIPDACSASQNLKPR